MLATTNCITLQEKPNTRCESNFKKATVQQLSAQSGRRFGIDKFTVLGCFLRVYIYIYIYILPILMHFYIILD